MNVEKIIDIVCQGKNEREGGRLLEVPFRQIVESI